jgi:hypothetical protein
MGTDKNEAVPTPGNAASRAARSAQVKSKCTPPDAGPVKVKIKVKTPGPKDRFYFSAGATHDADKTGYIEKMLKAFNDAGIKDPTDIAAHGGKVEDVQFTTGPNSWLPADAIVENRPTKWEVDEFGVRLPTEFSRIPVPTDWRITTTVGRISANLASTPMVGGEQVNLCGYSTGSVIMAQVALNLADSGQNIDFLVLIGSPISNASPLYKDLSSRPRVKRIIRIDIPGDDVATLNASSSGSPVLSRELLAAISFAWTGNEHPHFKYAMNSAADTARAELAAQLYNAGVR